MSLSSSSMLRSRVSLRWRYPASRIIVAAGSARVPLLGSAMRSMELSSVVLIGSAVQIGGAGSGGPPPTTRVIPRRRPRGCASVLSQVLVDVLERDPAADHDDLDPVEQLRDLLGQRVVRLVLGGQPHLAGLLEQLLALRVDTGVERGHRARPLRAGGGLLGQLREQLVEGLHRRTPLTGQVSTERPATAQPIHPPCCTRSAEIAGWPGRLPERAAR